MLNQFKIQLEKHSNSGSSSATPEQKLPLALQELTKRINAKKLSIEKFELSEMKKNTDLLTQMKAVDGFECFEDDCVERMVAEFNGKSACEDMLLLLKDDNNKVIGAIEFDLDPKQKTTIIYRLGVVNAAAEEHEYLNLLTHAAMQISSLYGCSISVYCCAQDQAFYETLGFKLDIANVELILEKRLPEEELKEAFKLYCEQEDYREVPMVFDYNNPDCVTQLLTNDLIKELIKDNPYDSLSAQLSLPKEGNRKTLKPGRN